MGRVLQKQGQGEESEDQPDRASGQPAPRLRRPRLPVNTSAALNVPGWSTRELRVEANARRLHDVPARCDRCVKPAPSTLSAAEI